MKDLKAGDYIFTETNEGVLTHEVLARLEDLVWTRQLFENGSKGSVEDVMHLDDLITYGWQKLARPQ